MDDAGNRREVGRRLPPVGRIVPVGDCRGAAGRRRKRRRSPGDGGARPRPGAAAGGPPLPAGERSAIDPLEAIADLVGPAAMRPGKSPFQVVPHCRFDGDRARSASKSGRPRPHRPPGRSGRRGPRPRPPKPNRTVAVMRIDTDEPPPPGRSGDRSPGSAGAGGVRGTCVTIRSCRGTCRPFALSGHQDGAPRRRTPAHFDPWASSERPVRHGTIESLRHARPGPRQRRFSNACGGCWTVPERRWVAAGEYPDGIDGFGRCPAGRGKLPETGALLSYRSGPETRPA